MKLQLYVKKEDAKELITGYNSKQVNLNGYVEIDEIEDNECEEIVFKNVLDCLPIESHETFFNIISKKLRLKGKMYFTFTSNNLIDFSNIEEINDLLKNNMSVSNMSHITNILTKNGLLIETLSKSGDKYELSTHRKS